MRLADRVGLRLASATAQALAGRALAAAGDRDAAVEALTAARSALDGYNARRLRDETERDLRDLGVRTWKRGPSARGDSLSEREAEVAALAAAGRTNRQIGDELFLSVKTVESHLRNVFAKLEVTSRVQLASVYSGAGATSPGPAADASA
jgi:DNA-binding NarL/FixJ family response regulator